MCGDAGEYGDQGGVRGGIYVDARGEERSGAVFGECVVVDCGS